MTEPWELTENEYRDIARSMDQVFFGTMIEPTYRAIATAAIQKYQEWLASQCGLCPCDDCEMRESCWRDTEQDFCADRHKWDGMQLGLAKGLQQLASQVGPKPCPQCELKKDCIEQSSPGWCTEPLYREWLGQQQGYAKAIEVVRNYRQELQDADELKAYDTVCSVLDRLLERGK